MRIAIVEDIAEERKLLRSRLETQFETRGIYAELVEFENGEDFLAAAKECSFPILFLDIYMSGENGVEVAKELREFDSDCLLIFTTTSVDHALDGFKVRAMQYLVKPYEEAELTKLIDEILSHSGFRKVHRDQSRWKQCACTICENCICGAFFSYDAYSHYKWQGINYATII